jgi:CelD/BcsL family acetyltransferase involved in cellulose biosynthesis
MSITIEEINKFSDAQRLKPDWDRIVEEGNLDIFQSFDFVMSLWEANIGKGEITLFIAKEGTEVLGIFPLVSDKSYIFGVLPVNTISLLKGSIPVTNDFIIKDKIPESIDALLNHLFTSRFKYDIFEITGYYSGITSDSKVSCWLKHSKHKKIIKRKIFPTLYIRFADSWEKYWQSRSGHFRQRIQRFERRLEEEGTFEVKYYASPDEMEFTLDKIHEIARESQRTRERKDVGVVIKHDDAKGVKDVKDIFYSSYFKKAAMTGNILAMFLCINNEYAAYILAFGNKNRCYEITTYYKEKYSEYSSGFILLKYMVKKLFEMGIKEYVLGVASWPGLHHLEWKNRWATGKDENYWVWAYNDKRPAALLIYYLRSLSGFIKKNRVSV